MTEKKVIPGQVQNDLRDEGEEDSGPVRNEAEKQETRFREDEHKMREMLIGRLTWISIAWLVFTALVVILQGVPVCFSLSDSVMVAFITSSLATVLGLWGIGLGYYFFVKR